LQRLINPRTKQSKEEIVRSMFPSYDADGFTVVFLNFSIVCIRLPQTNEEDYTAWHFERTGIFIVCSVHRLALLQILIASAQGQQSSEPDGNRQI
jgi:hypothetical protein